MSRRKRAVVYVDGFNFYHGVIRGGDPQNKWLDLERLFGLIRNQEDLVLVRYFTAEMWGEARQRQAVYLDALKTLPMVHVRTSIFKKKPVKGRYGPNNALKVRIETFEEKETDVALAVSMIDDAYNDRADVFVLVSSDTDFVPPLELLHDTFPNKDVVVYIPSRNWDKAAELRRFDAHRFPERMLELARFPEIVRSADDRRIERPSQWASVPEH